MCHKSEQKGSEDEWLKETLRKKKNKQTQCSQQNTNILYFWRVLPATDWCMMQQPSYSSRTGKSILSHGLREENHKQRRLHTGNLQEMKMAKKQPEWYHGWKCSQEQKDNRKRRKLLCIKIVSETQGYGCFKALGQKQLHSERKQSSSLRNLPREPPIKFKQREGNKRGWFAKWRRLFARAEGLFSHQ